MAPQLGSAPYNQDPLSFLPCFTHIFHLVQSLGRSNEVEFFLSKFVKVPTVKENRETWRLSERKTEIALKATVLKLHIF